MSDPDDTVDRDIAKLWTAHRELASVVWGDDVTRGNGLRSNVREQEERLKAVELVTRNLIQDLRHYLDKERPETCYGIKALKEHKEEEISLYEEGTEMKKTKLGMWGTILAASIPSIIGSVTTIIIVLTKVGS